MYILEVGLSYSLSREKFKSQFKLNRYSKDANGSVTTYSDKDGEVFSYDNDKQRLSVIRQGWQLRNVQRGY